METFFEVVLAGSAVAYIVEAILLILTIPAGFVKGIFTLPLATLAMWIFSGFQLHLFISAPAASFIALALMKLVNKPTVVQTSRRNY